VGATALAVRAAEASAIALTTAARTDGIEIFHKSAIGHRRR